MAEKYVLFIDGENLIHKIKDVIRQSGRRKQKITAINISKIIDESLPEIKINRKIFYGAKLREHEETIEKSKELIQNQRMLKSNLERQGVEVILAGNVRGQVIGVGKNSRVVFKEKGVDVKIAVDMVSMACDRKMTTAILCSSDSDLQPAVRECKKRGVKVFYLGFELIPNKGLTATTDRTILIRNSQVLDSF